MMLLHKNAQITFQFQSVTRIDRFYDALNNKDESFISTVGIQSCPYSAESFLNALGIKSEVMEHTYGKKEIQEKIH